MSFMEVSFFHVFFSVPD